MNFQQLHELSHFGLEGGLHPLFHSAVGLRCLCQRQVDVSTKARAPQMLSRWSDHSLRTGLALATNNSAVLTHVLAAYRLASSALVDPGEKFFFITYSSNQLAANFFWETIGLCLALHTQNGQKTHEENPPWDDNALTHLQDTRALCRRQITVPRRSPAPQDGTLRSLHKHERVASKSGKNNILTRP